MRSRAHKHGYMRTERSLVHARCYHVVAVHCSSTRAINLFKCYSEIISEHDRIVREFKFVACTQPRPIFRDVLSRLPYAYRRRRRRHIIRLRPSRSNVCTADGIENTRTRASAYVGDGRVVHYYANLGISGTHGVYATVYMLLLLLLLYTIHARLWAGKKSLELRFN